jgi:hypothetical protein
MGKLLNLTVSLNREIALGLGSYLFPMKSINYWSSAGTIAALGWEKELQSEQISNTVSQLIYDKSQRERMSELGKQMVDNQGLTRVLKIIEDLLLQ